MKTLLTLFFTSCVLSVFAATNGVIDLLPIGSPLISVYQAQYSNNTPRPNNFSYAMPAGDSRGLFVVFQEENTGNNGDYPTQITYGNVTMSPSSNTTIFTNQVTPKFLNVYVFFMNDSAASTRTDNIFRVTYFDASPKNNASYVFTVFTLDEVRQVVPVLMCSAQQTGGNLNTNDSIACGSSGQLTAGDLFISVGGTGNVNAGPLHSNFPDTIVNRASNTMWHAIFFKQATVTSFITPYMVTAGNNAGRFILLATIVNNVNNPNGGGSPLNIRLESFTAARYQEKTVINWKTVAESNLRHYEVQYSDNGRDFNTVGTVKPHTNGNTLIEQYYSFTDQLRTGKSYYRLKIVENTSAPSMYSPVVTVDKISMNLPDLIVYPNPSNGAFSISPVKPGTYDVKVVNMLGQNAGYEVIDGGDDFTLRLKSPVPGFYYIIVDNAGIISTTKAFVQ